MLVSIIIIELIIISISWYYYSYSVMTVFKTENLFSAQWKYL